MGRHGDPVRDVLLAYGSWWAPLKAQRPGAPGRRTIGSVSVQAQRDLLPPVSKGKRRPGALEVHDYQFLIVDDRYTVPTLRFVQATSAERALDLAQQALDENNHHLGVEVWAGDELLFTLGERHRPTVALT